MLGLCVALGAILSRIVFNEILAYQVEIIPVKKESKAESDETSSSYSSVEESSVSPNNQDEAQKKINNLVAIAKAVVSKEEVILYEELLHHASNCWPQPELTFDEAVKFLSDFQTKSFSENSTNTSKEEEQLDEQEGVSK